jgi:microcystin degradation protein MlrC
MVRVAVGMISHETNTFSPVPTTLTSFAEERFGLLDGEAVIDDLAGSKTGIGGFLDVARREGWEVSGTVAASATPSANVAADAYDELKGRMLRHLRNEGPFDGVLLHLHGAMLAKNAPDAEGDLCRAVRDAIGPRVPLVVELDLHGNITAEFCASVDAVFAYNTNPHVDAYERGVEAAECLAAILSGRIPRPSVYISKPPMLPPTINMRTAEGPMRQILDHGLDWEQRPEIVDVSVFGGFPYADFDQAGTSIVVTSTNPEIGTRCARELGSFAWSIRDQFLKEIPDIESALTQARSVLETSPGKPVVLADVADNPGGGGSGDTTGLLRALLASGLPGALACLWDPATVRRAIEVGEGNRGRFELGGASAPALYGDPVTVEGHVAHVSDGRFVGYGPVIRGRAVDCGPTARIDAGNLKFVVTSIRHAANDRGYFRVAGVAPEAEPLLVVKSRGHFRADFEPIAAAIIEVDAPGAANPNLDRYDFRRVRRPIWPLDSNATWDPESQP